MLYHGPVLRPHAFAATPKTHDLLIDAAGGGDATVIQTGLDTMGDAFTAFIKQGTYAAGFTEASSGVRIFVEPGTVIQAAIILSGDDITLILGSHCDVTAVITLSGNNCSLICMNGVDIDGVVLSGDKCLVDGGGWDTLIDGGVANEGLTVSGDDCIVRNISVQTTGGGGQAFHALSDAGARNSFVTIKVVDSDNVSMQLSGTGDVLVVGCVIPDSDSAGIFVAGQRGRVMDNYIASGVAGAGIQLTGAGDNSVVVGNIVDAPTNTLVVDAAAENCVVVGNRVDGAVNDSSGTSTVADNDETAF